MPLLLNGVILSRKKRGLFIKTRLVISNSKSVGLILTPSIMLETDFANES